MGGIGSGGHNRKSAPVHRLAGTFRADRHGQKVAGSKALDVQMPNCPTWLGREAKREWRRITPLLEETGIITLLDRSTIAGYCTVYESVWRLERLIAEHGYTFTANNGNEVARPEVAMLDKARSQLSRYAVLLGLTPQSRERLVGRAAEVPEREKPTNRFAGYG